MSDKRPGISKRPFDKFQGLGDADFQIGPSAESEPETPDPIKLPRVSPENLVEGERYLVRVGHNGKVREEIAYARPYGTHGKFSFMVGQDWFADEVEAIGGPLPKFEIEET